MIDKAYKLLISKLNITDKHQQNLQERGFTDKQIEQLDYKSLPIKRSHIVNALAEQCELQGVPGFWKNAANGKWQLAGKAGMLIPVRDAKGDIFSLKIRADDDSRAKYLHLSSNPKPSKTGEIKYPGGTAAKIGVHHPATGTRTSTIRITEGELKADIATLLSDTYTISIPGIAMWESAIEAIDDLGPKQILLAFDSDKDKEYSTSTNVQAQPFAVAKALANLYLALKEKGYNTIIESWDEGVGKGIDDVLAAGFSDKIKQMSQDEVEDFVKNALVEDMPLDWIYVIGTKRFIHLSTMQELDKEQFSDKFAPDFKKARAADKVMRHPGFPRADAPTYWPGKPTLIEQQSLKYLNLWRPSGVGPEEGNMDIFNAHCTYMLPDERERNIFLDFIAFCLQKPGEKIAWALLLQGKQGTGKSYFGTVMRLLLGEHNVSSPSNESIHEPYTGWQKSCQLVVIEELMARGRLELMNKLKPMITQPIAVIREMYKPPYEQPNRFNLLMFTNHEDAIIIDETDRRYGVLFSPAEPKPAEYYTALWDWTFKNAGCILRELLARDISSFNPNAHAPDTKAKQQLIADSLPPLGSWLSERIETESWPFLSDIITIQHLIECLPTNLKNTPHIAVSKALKKLGARPLKQVRLTSGSYARLISVRRHEMWTSADDTALVETYEKWLQTSDPGGNPLADSKPF